MNVSVISSNKIKHAPDQPETKYTKGEANHSHEHHIEQIVVHDRVDHRIVQRLLGRPLRTGHRHKGLGSGRQRLAPLGLHFLPHLLIDPAVVGLRVLVKGDPPQMRPTGRAARQRCVMPFK